MSVLQCQFCGCYFTPKRYKGTACCGNLCATKLNYYRKHNFETPYEMGRFIRESFVNEISEINRESNSNTNESKSEILMSEENEKLLNEFKLKSKKP